MITAMLLAAEAESLTLAQLFRDAATIVNERPFIAALVAVALALVVTAWGTFRKPPRISTSSLAQPRLLLTEFVIDEEEMLVRIRGRLPGIFAFMAKLGGVNTETMMLATPTRVEFRTSNLSGEVSQVTPIPSVAMIECGFSRPFSALMVAILLGTTAAGLMSYGQYGLALIALSLCLGMIFLYMLAKRFFIAVQTLRNDAHVLEFRRSFVDKTVISIEETQRAMSLLSKIVESHGNEQSDAMREARQEAERERIEEAVQAAGKKAKS